MSAAFFPREDVGEMHFNEGNFDGKEGITNGEASMRKGGRVQHRALRPARQILNRLHQLAFMIGLKPGDLEPQSLRFLSDQRIFARVSSGGSCRKRRQGER